MKKQTGASSWPKEIAFPPSGAPSPTTRPASTVRQLTNYKGHSHHLYFTNPGWYDGGRKLLFGSDRGNCTNLFSIELASGEITQLTDLDQPPPPAETSFLFASVNPRRAEVYFWHGRDLVALDLEFAGGAPALPGAGRLYDQYDQRNRRRQVYLHRPVRGSIRANSRSTCCTATLGSRSTGRPCRSRRCCGSTPTSGAAEVVFEEHYWIGHVNTSPTLPHILTFCHEGPWEQVDNRIWGLDMTSGRTWKIRPGPAGERVGHEYWFADGEQIGYHGRSVDGEPFYGSMRYDNTGQVEAPFPHELEPLPQ